MLGKLVARALSRLSAVGSALFFGRKVALAQDRGRKGAGISEREEKSNSY